MRRQADRFRHQQVAVRRCEGPQDAVVSFTEAPAENTSRVPLATAPARWQTTHVLDMLGQTFAVNSCGGVAHVDAAT